MRAKIFFHKRNELNKWPTHVIHCFAFNKWRETNDIFEMIFKLPFLTKYELGIHRIDLAHFLETVKSEIQGGARKSVQSHFYVFLLDRYF